jgi:hypothetical protein
VSDGDVHSAFGLTYANYLVWPRALMQEMPPEWQAQFVALADEFWAAWDDSADREYAVQVRDEAGLFKSDPLAEYRRPDMDLIDSLRRETAGSFRPNTPSRP